MTTQTHTSGPWVCRRPPEPVPNVEFWIDDARNIPIADIKTRDNPECYARLIAAAPELVAALEDMIDIAARYGAEADCDGNFIAARAALAKAKGEVT